MRQDFDSIDDYVAYMETQEAPFNPHWCSRHWAPCPVEKLNGALAAVIMMQESFALVPEGVTSPTALNSWWQNVTTPACCQFGDEKMDKLWDLVRKLRDEKLCMSIDALPKGRHACFLDKGHDGLHDYEMPPASIFD